MPRSKSSPNHSPSGEEWPLINHTPNSKDQSPLVRRALACHTYTVDSIEKAVELATRFKAEGKYDWFRGQQKNWPLYPTAARLGTGPEEQKRVTDEQLLLLTWIRETPGLSEISNDIDAVLSIAQHYGIPTSLLDFTTDPGIAGYFASMGKKDSAGKGYIYCLNTGDLRRFDREMCEYYSDSLESPEIAFIRPDVPNLWRMEAQHSVFLFAPSNFFDYYLIDEIEFPHPSRLSFPTARDVYPERKSPLELQLNHYFSISAVSQWHEAFRKVFPNAKTYHIEAPPNGVHAEFFRCGTIPKMTCWKKTTMNLWQRLPTERLRDTALGEIGLQVDLRAEASVLRERVAFGIKRALSIDPTLRMKAVNWVLLPQRRLQAKLRDEIDQVWNGMRSLPFEDSIIADAVALCFALHRCGFAEADEDEAYTIVSKLLGESVKVGMSDTCGSSSYGYVATADLAEAVRSDIHERLRKKYIEAISTPFSLLQMCSSPMRLFRFEAFCRLFGSQIIPTQIMRGESRGVFFSPARIEGFGLP